MDLLSTLFAFPATVGAAIARWTRYDPVLVGLVVGCAGAGLFGLSSAAHFSPVFMGLFLFCAIIMGVTASAGALLGRWRRAAVEGIR